jgi:hypothetical protein
MNKIISNNNGNEIISKMIESGKPFSITRLRSETDILEDKLNNNIRDSFNTKYDVNGGIINPNKKTLLDYSNKVEEGIKNSDLLVYWTHLNNQYINYKNYINCNLIENRAVEPFYFDNPWSSSLKDKKVLVIHPFAETIKKQYDKKDLLFNNKEVLPDFELITYKPYQTSCKEDVENNSWVELLDDMCEKIKNIDFDIALIGCGCYDIPLSTHIKNIGKQSIIMGGGLQIMFGIKGKRWDNHSFISKLYNENWVRPSNNEKPKDFRKVEGGCYW